MRKFAVAVSFLFLVSLPGLAQQTNGANTVTLLLSNPELSHSRAAGTDFDLGFGVALDHRFNPHLSGELTVTRQRYIRHEGVFAPPTGFTDIRQSYSSWPVDANVSYHFLTGSRWKPYVGGGLRYVRETFQPFGFLTGTPLPKEQQSSVDPEVSGGVLFQFRPSLGLRLDVKRVLSNGRSLADPDMKFSAGLGWRF